MKQEDRIKLQKGQAAQRVIDPISPTEVAMAVSAAFALGHPVALGKVIKGFMDTFPSPATSEEKTTEGKKGECRIIEELGPTWWRPIVEACEKVEDKGWKAQWMLLQEAKRRNVPIGKDALVSILARMWLQKEMKSHVCTYICNTHIDDREGGGLRAHVIRVLEEVSSSSLSSPSLCPQTPISKVLIGSVMGINSHSSTSSVNAALSPQAFLYLEKMEEDDGNKKEQDREIQKNKPTPKDYHEAIVSLVR